MAKKKVKTNLVAALLVVIAVLCYGPIVNAGNLEPIAGPGSTMKTLDDLANFLADWMSSGSVPGNIDLTGNVDAKDFNILSQVWLDYCPDGWLLK